MPKVAWINNRFVSVPVRIAFVTFATGRYVGHDVKLRESIGKWCPYADVYAFRSFEEIGSPLHPDNPYAFKVYAVKHVRSLGYDVVIWVDSINRLSRPFEPVLDELGKVGVYLQADGWKVGEWTNDRSLAYFGVSRDDMMDVECCYACVMGFDFRTPIAQTFVDLWKKAADDGVFRGNWDNASKTESQDPRCRGHRHDQACADIIAYKLGIPKSRSLLGEKSQKYFTSFRFP